MPVKILFADDSAVDRLILKSMLSDYDIVTAGDGAEAMHRIREQSDIKLVILDLNMPAMEGFQVLDALRAEDRLHSMRIIILTSSDEVENEIKGLQLGAVDFIRKPFQRDTLRARVRTHIEMLLIKQELEQKLQTQGLTYELIFEQAPIGIAISFGSDPSDAQQNAHYSINPMYEQITGRSKASLLELGWARITHPDDLAQDIEQYAKLQAGDIDAYSIEKRLIKPDGSIVWVQLSVSA